MKIIVFGARGDVGSRVVNEALSRGHEVTGVVRRREQIDLLPEGVAGLVAEATSRGEVINVMEGQDVAVSALRPPEGRETLLVPMTRSVLDAAAETGTRVVLVGGAASLILPDGSGHTVLSKPGFLPDAVVPIATACQDQYDMSLAEADAEWTYLSPPAMLLPGKRSGTYRQGSDILLFDEKGESGISMEDFAVAILDEVEAPAHQRERFTVAA